MSSLADAPDLVGFFSYSREDDEDSGGKLSKLRERIQAELRVQRPHEERFQTMAGQGRNCAWRVVGRHDQEGYF